MGCVPNGANLRVICMKKSYENIDENRIIVDAKYDTDIPRISYADPS